MSPRARGPRRVTLRFGPAGVPHSSARPGTEHGIRRAGELGLGCFEMAWGNGVRMGDTTAARIAAAARETGLELTAHAPYFLNLSGAAEVAAASETRLLDAARLAGKCGARGVVFHAGWYGTLAPRAAWRKIATALRRIARRLRNEDVAVELRPELTGRAGQAGTLEEIVDWSADIAGVAPCIDFSHHYARGGGAANRYEDFRAMLEHVRTRLGDAALGRMHVHLSGIQYGPGGERRHEPLAKTRFRWREVLRALRDAGAGGRVIAESPEIERDALKLQRAFRRLR